MKTPIRSCALLPALLLLAAGCVNDATLTNELLAEAEASQASAPLGGEALFQRKLELDRAVRDMGHFHATLKSLDRRYDRGSEVLFQEFVEFYLTKHVLPMLEGEWQSQHPEVAVLDVNARFVAAELWSMMGASGRADQMERSIAERYRGRGSMIVAYPVGEESTLADGLALLRRL